MEKRPTKFLQSHLFLLLLGCSLHALAQHASIQEGKGKASYFIDLNTRGTSQVHYLPDRVCSIRYFDAYGIEDYLPLTIYNWKHEKVSQYYLEKSYGLNHYDITVELMSGQTYYLTAMNEMGEKYKATIYYKGTVTSNPPEVNITVDAENVDCDLPEGNLVHYRAHISGGRPPYQVKWFIADDTMSKLLYRPRSERLERDDRVATVQVDAPPAYHVLVQVRDACNLITNQVVSIGCEKKKNVRHALHLSSSKLKPKPKKTMKNP